MEPQNDNSSTAKGKVPIVPIVAAVAVIVVGVVVFMMMNKPKATVPDLVFLERGEAEVELSKVGLKLGNVTERADEQTPIGDIVLETNPAAETNVEQGSTVDIVVSAGPKVTDDVTVPDLTGLSAEEAEQKLTEALLVPQPGKPVNSDTVEAGKVCAQSVAPESKIRVLTVVSYSTSLGKENVEVPDVVGKSVADARKALEDVGLGVDTIVAYNNDVAKDVVISQKTAKGEKVAKGTVITIEVSLGGKPAAKVVVPNIISYNRDDAIRALESAGLKYVYSGDEDGTVVQVRPGPNTQVDQGSMVTFELKRPQAPTPSQSENQGNSGNAGNSGNNNSGNSDSGNSGSGDNDSGNTGDESGTEAKYTQEDCIAIATDYAGAGGQAKGPALDVSADGPITGGGTVYYKVEFNLGDVHYSVQVDAIEGHVISADETFNGTQRLLDENGEPVEGTEQSV